MTGLQSVLPWRSTFLDLRDGIGRLPASEPLLARTLELLGDYDLAYRMALGLGRLGGLIEQRLLRNRGVLLELGFDEWIGADRQRSFHFHFITIVGAGASPTEAHLRRAPDLRVVRAAQTLRWRHTRSLFFWFDGETVVLSPYLPEGASVP